MTTKLDELKALMAAATPGPWAWDQRGEKTNEWGLGVALRNDDTPIVGYFNDDEVIYVEAVCSHEAATCNYGNPKLICAMHEALPALIAAVEALRDAYSVGQIVGGSKKAAQAALAPFGE